MTPEDGEGYPLQYSGLENSTDCIVHGVAELDMTEKLTEKRKESEILSVVSNSL